MAGILLDFDGKKFGLQVDRWIGHYKRKKDIWEPMKLALQNTMKYIFETRGGGKWPRLTPEYKKRKLKWKGKKGKLFPAVMVLTGRAYNAFTSDTNDSVWVPSDNGFVFGAKVLISGKKGRFDYPEAHQKGIQYKGRRNLFRQRKMLDKKWFTDRRHKIANTFFILVAEHFREAAKKAGISGNQSKQLELF